MLSQIGRLIQSHPVVSQRVIKASVACVKLPCVWLYFSTGRSLRGRIEKFLIRRPFLGNLLHELFWGDKPLLNQQLRQCVSLREAGDEKFFLVTGMVLPSFAIPIPRFEL